MDNMNAEMVKINGVDIGIKEYMGNRVITFKDIDRVHERKNGTARNRFYQNKSRFVEGVDFFKATKNDVDSQSMCVKHTSKNIDVNNKGIILITESGYLMLVKPFTDDLSWKVQRHLVNSYFKLKTIMEEVDTGTNAEKAVSNIRNKRLIEKERKDSKWITEMFEDIDSIIDLMRTCHGQNYECSKIIHIVIEHIEDNYDIDVGELFENYKREYAFLNKKLYVLEAISHDEMAKMAFTESINFAMDRFGIYCDKHTNVLESVLTEQDTKILILD